MTTETEPLVIARVDVAKALGCSERQIRYLEKRGSFPIPRLKFGRKHMYSAELVRQLAAGQLKLLTKEQAARKALNL
jgi:DNA-binding transcriptional MerR regulator